MSSSATPPVVSLPMCASILSLFLPAWAQRIAPRPVSHVPGLVVTSPNSFPVGWNPSVPDACLRWCAGGNFRIVPLSPFTGQAVDSADFVAMPGAVDPPPQPGCQCTPFLFSFNASRAATIYGRSPQLGELSVLEVDDTSIFVRASSAGSTMTRVFGAEAAFFQPLVPLSPSPTVPATPTPSLSPSATPGALVAGAADPDTRVVVAFGVVVGSLLSVIVALGVAIARMKPRKLLVIPPVPVSTVSPMRGVPPPTVPVPWTTSASTAAQAHRTSMPPMQVPV